MMKLVYHLSDAARKRMFLETGRDPGRDQALEVDPVALSQEDRAQLLELRPIDTTGPAILANLPEWGPYGIKRSAFDVLTLDAVASDPVALLAAYRDAARTRQIEAELQRDAALAKLIDELNRWPADRDMYRSEIEARFAGAPRLAEAEAALAAAKDRYAAYAAAERAKSAAQAAAAQAERAQRDAERRAWIEAHGSVYLKKCLAGGYDCQRRYVIERAALEHPGYVVDYNDAAEWKDRSGPSEAALDEAARVGGLVVWLTAAPSAATGDDTDDESEDEYEFAACEAVAIRAYLGKYDLIKVM